MQKISAGKFHFEPSSPFTSFNHLVGSGEQAIRHGKAESLGGLEGDHKLVLGRGLHRKIGRLLALEDAIHIAGRALVLVDLIKPVGSEATGCRVVAERIGTTPTAP